METRRWTNPSQPQTLYLAVVLFYINAVMSLIFGNAVDIFGFAGRLAFIVGSVAAGLGIANEKKWGYILGVVTSIFQLVPFILVIAVDGVGVVFDLGPEAPLAKDRVVQQVSGRKERRDEGAGAARGGPDLEACAFEQPGIDDAVELGARFW